MGEVLSGGMQTHFFMQGKGSKVARGGNRITSYVRELDCVGVHKVSCLLICMYRMFAVLLCCKALHGAVPTGLLKTFSGLFSGGSWIM